MHRRDPQEFLPLHPLEFRILLALHRGATHGYEIVQSMQSTGDGPLYPANLYRRIRDLLDAGLLAETPPPNSSSAEPRRRYLAITELGGRVARLEAQRLEALVAAARDAHVLGGEAI